MIIFGTALLAICYLAGVALGDLIGVTLGTKTNVGGVGIAMLLLLAARIIMHRRDWLTEKSERGVGFWAAMYIPVVIAMAATQNVVSAVRSGLLAVLAAAATVMCCFGLVALINRRSARPEALADVLPEPVQQPEA